MLGEASKGNDRASSYKYASCSGRLRRATTGHLLLRLFCSWRFRCGDAEPAREKQKYTNTKIIRRLTFEESRIMTNIFSSRGVARSHKYNAVMLGDASQGDSRASSYKYASCSGRLRRATTGHLLLRLFCSWRFRCRDAEPA